MFSEDDCLKPSRKLCQSVVGAYKAERLWIDWASLLHRQLFSQTLMSLLPQVLVPSSLLKWPSSTCQTNCKSLIKCADSLFGFIPHQMNFSDFSLDDLALSVLMHIGPYIWYTLKRILLEKTKSTDPVFSEKNWRNLTIIMIATLK